MNTPTRSFVVSLSGALLALTGLAAAPAAAAADLLTNGSFETPYNACGTYCNYGVGSAQGSSFSGWSVVDLGAGGVDTSPGRDGYVSLVPNATFASYGVASPYGNQFADLTGVNGQGKGVLSDAVATEFGATYRVSFALGEFWVRGQGSYGAAAVNVAVNGVSQGLFVNPVSLGSPGSDWQTYSFDFVAGSSSTRLQITNALGPKDYSYLGTGLDNVSMTYLSAPPSPAPEPASLALMASGLAMLAGWRRRSAKR